MVPHIKVVNDRYEIPVPLKTDVVNTLLNNFTGALERTKSLRCKALKDPKLKFTLTDIFQKLVNEGWLVPLTLSLPRSSIDDLVFSVFLSNFFKLSYKISLMKNRFVTLFFIRFS